MLLNFSVKNYLSILEEVNLSMLTSSLREANEIPRLAFSEIGNDFKVLPVAIIYGANASGKSNLLKAMDFMMIFAVTSFGRNNVQSKILVEPFAFSENSTSEPSEFEVTFLINNRIYRYGFAATQELIVEEWLYEKEVKYRSKERELFFRENNTLTYSTSHFKKGKVIKEENLIKEDVLILTLANQLNDETAKLLIEWMVDLNVVNGHRDQDYQSFSKSHFINRTPLSEDMEKLIVFADTNIQKVSISVIDNKTEIVTSHPVFNEEGELIGTKSQLLNQQGSEGTKKLFNLSGPIIQTLNRGQMLIIDEMDSKLHPNLMEKLFLMFQDTTINTKGAQLIFATHNTNLLNSRLVRRDQVWITEKNKQGATQLYSIADYKTSKGKARNTEALEQNYIDGKYGGVPFLGELENFLEEYRHEQETA